MAIDQVLPKSNMATHEESAVSRFIRNPKSLAVSARRDLTLLQLELTSRVRADRWMSFQVQSPSNPLVTQTLTVIVTSVVHSGGQVSISVCSAPIPD